jgi:hypothetical protein
MGWLDYNEGPSPLHTFAYLGSHDRPKNRKHLTQYYSTSIYSTATR